MAAQRLNNIKVKKAIQREQQQLGERLEDGALDGEKLHRQLDMLMETMNYGTWSSQEDRTFVEQQRHKILGHKRKINENDDRMQWQEELQEMKRRLEDAERNMTVLTADVENEKKRYKRELDKKYKKKIDDINKFIEQLNDAAEQIAQAQMPRRGRIVKPLNLIEIDTNEDEMRSDNNNQGQSANDNVNDVEPDD